MKVHISEIQIPGIPPMCARALDGTRTPTLSPCFNDPRPKLAEKGMQVECDAWGPVPDVAAKRPDIAQDSPGLSNLGLPHTFNWFTFGLIGPNFSIIPVSNTELTENNSLK